MTIYLKNLECNDGEDDEEKSVLNSIFQFLACCVSMYVSILEVTFKLRLLRDVEFLNIK